jgi:predicted amidohydrolase
MPFKVIYIQAYQGSLNLVFTTAPGGESDTLAILDEDACVECIEANRDVIVGVKVRLQSSVCDKGRLEEEAYRYAV